MLLRKQLPDILKVILPIATTVLVAIILWPVLYRWASSRVTVTGPMDAGWPFTVVAINGNEVIDLAHEWFESPRGLGAAASNSGSDPITRAAAREALESRYGRSYVWADTGRANKPLRYYLTPADVEKANSEIDNLEPENYRAVQVEVLDDDPVGKRQIVQVTDCDEDDDVINVYRVEDERIQPVVWSRCRPGRAVLPMLIIICLPVFVVSAMLWKWLLGIKQLSHSPSSANP